MANEHFKGEARKNVVHATVEQVRGSERAVAECGRIVSGNKAIAIDYTKPHLVEIDRPLITCNGCKAILEG